LLLKAWLVSVKLMMPSCFAVSGAKTFSLVAVTGQNTNMRVTLAVVNIKTAE